MALMYNRKVNKTAFCQFNKEELKTQLKIVISFIYFFPNSTILTLSSVTGFHAHIYHRNENLRQIKLKKKKTVLQVTFFTNVTNSEFDACMNTKNTCSDLL